MKAFCRGCERETPWAYAGGQNGDLPKTDYWTCRDCGLRRLQLVNVLDVEGLCIAIVDGRLRQIGNPRRSIDFEDAVAHLYAEAWATYLRWDPTRGVPFLAYATGMLRNRLSDWYRENYGRTDPKAHVGALDISDEITRDDGELDRAFALADHADQISADLQWALGQNGKPPPTGISPSGRNWRGLSVKGRETLREIALPIAVGLQHAEVARILGRTDAYVAARMRDLRRELDGVA